MTKNRTIRPAALALTVAFAHTTAIGQDVVLSEVYAGPGGGWVELQNRGSAAADVSAWALFLATATPGQAQTYWWGFRPGTSIDAGGYLIVRWLAPIPAVPVPGEIATGDTAASFLFGLGAEPLPAQRGALGLWRSQGNSQTNSVGAVADWISWGAGGLSHEGLAAQTGQWVAGRAAPAMSPGSSLARFPGLELPDRPEQVWFVDGSPTPGAGNVGAAAVQSLGGACAPVGHHLLGTPALVASGLPLLGRADFALQVTNTTGTLLEFCLVAFAADTLPAGLPHVLPPTPGDDACLLFLDLSTWFDLRLLHTAATRTTLPLGMQNLPAALAGASFAVQALVFDNWATAWPPYQGLTDALRLTIGN